MSNPRPRQELVQEHAEQNSELPAHNRYNKYGCPNITTTDVKNIKKRIQMVEEHLIKRESNEAWIKQPT